MGTKTRPVFAPPKPLTAVNEIVNSHHEVGVDAVDLDGDGSLDLLVGNGDTGMIHFFRHDFLQKAGTPPVAGPRPRRARSIEEARGEHCKLTIIQRQ